MEIDFRILQKHACTYNDWLLCWLAICRAQVLWLHTINADTQNHYYRSLKMTKYILRMFKILFFLLHSSSHRFRSTLVIFVIYKNKNFCCSRNGCQTYTFYMRKKTIIFNNLILCINYVLRMGLFNSYKNKEGELYCADLYWCMHFIALLQIGFSVR